MNTESTILTRRKFMQQVAIGGMALAGSSPLLSCISSKKSLKKKPNVLYIMSDDHAANAISAYEGWLSETLPTPNIDRIAKQGMRFDNCFCTNSICTPSRASILTGQYGHVNGVRTLDDPLPIGTNHVAHELQKSGYETAIIGKYHLHGDPQGFDHWNVLTGVLGQGTYFDPVMKNQGGDEKVYPGYATDVVTDETLKWLESRDDEKPFFLVCQHKAPHGLWEYPPRYEHLLDGVEVPEPPSFWEDKSHRSESTKGYGSNLYKLGKRMEKGSAGKEWPTGQLDASGMDSDQIKKAGYQKYIKDYLRCVAAIDENVGRALDYLDQSGLAENTVVIYTSDQGQFLGEHDYYDKRWMYEDSLRMPFLVRYPGTTQAGSIDKSLVLNIDFAPLFLDIAGAEKSTAMQGSSFLPQLSGAVPENWRSSMYYRYWMHMAHHNVPAHYGIRTDRYKLIFFYGLGLGLVGEKTSETMDKTTEALDHYRPSPPGWELYDLKEDPGELKNVYDDPQYSDVIKNLKVELLKLKKQYGDTDDIYPDLMKVREQVWDD